MALLPFPCVEVYDSTAAQNFKKSTFCFFRQNGARSHTNKDTIKYLTDCVLEIITPEEWPPSCLDLKPLDYLIWSIAEQIVYCKRITNVEYLKKRVVQAWKEISHETINKCINHFKPRLQIMLAEEWKSFEDLLWTLLIFKLVKFLNFQYLRTKRLQHECVIMHLIFPQF